MSFVATSKVTNNAKIGQDDGPRQCPAINCGSYNYETTGEGIFCSECGAVIESGAFDMSVSFTDNQDGSRSVNGQFVSSMCTTPYHFSAGGGGFGFSRDSREVTVSNGKRHIQSLAAALKLSHFVDPAHRLFLSAVQRNFVHGRKTSNVVAACLYVVCRQRQAPHLLIDFSDVLQTNVFVLGNTFLKIRRLLQLELPAIDPAHYINRFASRLEFGNQQHDVVKTAHRLVARMTRDWLLTGRRPSGICGAALLLAARIHNLSRTQKEMVNVMRICEDTLRRRLNEFESTPSGSLTIDEFFSKDLPDEANPPAYMRNRLLEAEALRKKKGQLKLVAQDDAVNNNSGTDQDASMIEDGDINLQTSGLKKSSHSKANRKREQQEMYDWIAKDIEQSQNFSHAADLEEALALVQSQVADMLPPGVSISLPSKEKPQIEEAVNVNRSNSAALQGDKRTEKVNNTSTELRVANHNTERNEMVSADHSVDIMDDNRNKCEYDRQMEKVSIVKNMSNKEIVTLLKNDDVEHVEHSASLVEFKEGKEGPEMIVETTEAEDDAFFEADDEIDSMIRTKEETDAAKVRWQAENMEFLEKEKRERAEGKVKRKRKRKLRDGEMPSALESTRKMVSESKKISKKVDYEKWKELFDE